MKNELIKSIGLELADIRRSRELQIITVSEATKLNKDTISKYENGNSSMKIYIINILLEYYGIDLLYFFTKVHDRMQNNKPISEEITNNTE